MLSYAIVVTMPSPKATRIPSGKQPARVVHRGQARLGDRGAPSRDDARETWIDAVARRGCDVALPAGRLARTPARRRTPREPEGRRCASGRRALQARTTRQPRSKIVAEAVAIVNTKGKTPTRRKAYQSEIVAYVRSTSRFRRCASSCRTTARNAGGSAICLVTSPPLSATECRPRTAEGESGRRRVEGVPEPARFLVELRLPGQAPELVDDPWRLIARQRAEATPANDPVGDEKQDREPRRRGAAQRRRASTTRASHSCPGGMCRRPRSPMCARRCRLRTRGPRCTP